MEKVRNGILVLEQPINGGLVIHSLGNRLGRRFSIGFEEHFWIILCIDDGRVEPDRNDNPKIVCFGFGDVTGSNRIQDTVSDCRLNGTHQDVGVFLRVHGDFANHDRGGADLYVAI